MPPLSEPATVQEAARLALTQGVAWFKERAAQDPEGWLVGPGRTYRVIGQTNVTVRYRMATVPQPIWEYTNVVEFVQDSTAGAPRRTVQSRPWRVKGTNHVERLVPDRNGPEVREEVRPVYDPKGNVYWRFSDLGDSALAVHALRRAGVPDTDPVIERNLANLREAIDTYGLPDGTWNLAWLTVVFAETPGKEAAALTTQLASRLVDGQLRDGPGRGLWGPESFHHRLLAVALRDFLARDAELQAANQKLKERDTPANQKEVDNATAALDREKMTLDELTRQLLRLTAVESPFVWDPNAEPSVRLAGTSSFFYNQTAADLESTAVAALGLAAAAAQQRLPAESVRPEPPAAPKPAPGTLPRLDSRPATLIRQPLAIAAPPERALTVLARAANTLAARQLRDGRWDEANVHQPVTDFDTFKAVLPVPAIVNSFVPLESPVTTASAANGALTMAAIGRAVGADKLGPDLRRVQDAGLAAAARELDQWIRARRPEGKRPATFLTNDVAALLPATVLLSQKQVGDGAADELIRWLVLAGQTNGVWRAAQRLDYLPSSNRARLAALAKQPGGVITNLNLGNLKSAHIGIHNAVVLDANSATPSRYQEAYFTALAVLCLASYLDQPAAALTQYDADETLPAQRTAMHARLRQPPPPPAPVPVVPPAAAPKPPAEPAPVPESPLNAVPAPPPPVEKKPQADETF